MKEIQERIGPGMEVQVAITEKLLDS